MVVTSRKMTLDELQNGDVLIFEGSLSDDAWWVKIITNADVFHAAMMFRSGRDVIEQVPPNVRSVPTQERFSKVSYDLTLYVMRPSFADKLNLAPVMEVAAKHLNNKEPYPRINLYVAVFAAFAQEHSWIRDNVGPTFLKVLRFLSWGLIKAIDALKFGYNAEPMVCSEFIHRCFLDAGEEFDLGLVFQGSEDKHLCCFNGVIGENDKTSFVAQVKQQHTLQQSDSNSIQIDEKEMLAIDENKLFHEFQQALLKGFPSKDKQDNSAGSNTQLSEELVTASVDFAVAIARFGLSTHGLSQDQRNALSETQALQYFEHYISTFVAPINLMRDCRSLELVGHIEI